MSQLQFLALVVKPPFDLHALYCQTGAPAELRTHIRSDSKLVIFDRRDVLRVRTGERAADKVTWSCIRSCCDMTVAGLIAAA